MSEVVNLRMARKRAARDKATHAAEENRRAHGIPRSERERSEAERQKASQTLDQHRIEPGDPR